VSVGNLTEYVCVDRVRRGGWGQRDVYSEQHIHT
jgi:hypothetical protein